MDISFTFVQYRIDKKMHSYSAFLVLVTTESTFTIQATGGGGYHERCHLIIRSHNHSLALNLGLSILPKKTSSGRLQGPEIDHLLITG